MLITSMQGLRRTQEQLLPGEGDLVLSQVFLVVSLELVIHGAITAFETNVGRERTME